MSVAKIRLSSFRNFKNNLFEFSDKVTVIVGPNASGKTNLLEGLYLLSTGKSFKVKVEEEMINYAKDLARVKGRIEKQDGKTDLEIVVTRGVIDLGGQRSERIPKKKLTVNGLGKRLIDFAGHFRVVLFGPWDMDLVTEAPSLRRRFLDSVLSQMDREYRRSLLSYDKGLRQRNKLLLRIREEGLSRSQLLFWDKLLIRNGDYLTSARQKFINYANSVKVIDGQKFELEYDKSAISEGRLEQYTEEEIAAATTLVGPHRDDFGFKIIDNKNKVRNLATYGSRGEQRMGVLWLKLTELSFIEETTGEKPSLLLDDIFSELDHKHRDVVIKLAKNQQTIITTADPHYVTNFKKVVKIKLKR